MVKTEDGFFSKWERVIKSQSEKEFADRMTGVLQALQTVRVPAICEETAIHDAIGEALTAAGIHYKHEFRVQGGKRFDFWVRGVVIEVKKGMPPKLALLNQLKRYASVAAVSGVIIVSQKVIKVPGSLNGKPIVSVSLNKNWGVAF